MTPGAAQQARNPKAKLENIAMGAVRRRFAPEFVNRIDGVITYLPLESDSLRQILDQLLEGLQLHIDRRLEDRAFDLDITKEARDYLLEKGTSKEYGYRELKPSTILRQITQPIAAMVDREEIEPGSTVRVNRNRKKDGLDIVVEEE